MAVLDLQKRTTESWEDYDKFKCSSDSLIFVEGGIILEKNGPVSIDLTVGNSYSNNNSGEQLEIDAKGVKLAPHKSIVITTQQKIALPYNVFGSIYGIGRNIFRGAYISTGRINPGFNDRLKIGLYNSSDKEWIIKQNDSIACCAFYDIESCLSISQSNNDSSHDQIVKKVSKKQKISSWLRRNLFSILSLTVAIVAVIVAIV